MSDKDKWLAATGYILVLLDTFSVQFANFYQFSLLGYYVNIFTITPLVVFYAINKANSMVFISSHLKRAMSVYIKYIIFSIISGVLFEPNNLWLYFAGVGVTILMLIVMLYVAFACGKGIVRVFKLEPAIT